MRTAKHNPPGQSLPSACQAAHVQPAPLPSPTHSTTRTTVSVVSHDPETSPFAAVVASSGPMAKSNPFRFSTKWWDDETGIGWWGYRFYDPGTGRWVGRDPITERGGLNLYVIVDNSLLQYVDNLGHTKMVTITAIEWIEAWALIYRVAYVCEACPDQETYGWVRSGTHKGLLKSVVAPWLRFEQKAQYTVEKSTAGNVASMLANLIPGQWAGSIASLVLDLLNTETIGSTRTLLGDLNTIEVNPLPRLKELGECSSRTVGTSGTKDEISVEFHSGGVTVVDVNVPN